MKKVFFILVFMLMGSVTFANNSIIEGKEKNEVIEKVNLDYKEVVKIFQNGLFCIETHYVYFDGELIGEFEIETYGVYGDCGFTMHFDYSENYK